MAADHSFQTFALLWWAQWPEAKSPRHADDVLRRLNADIFPAIGKRPVSEIQAPKLVATVRAIAGVARSTVKRALQSSRQVFRHSIAHGLATLNPATDIKPADVLASREKVNSARVDSKALPELMRHIDAYQGAAVTRLAMKLMALTFVRTSELIAARWEEFDLEAARWNISAARMKMKTPHIVHLTGWAGNYLVAPEKPPYRRRSGARCGPVRILRDCARRPGDDHRLRALAKLDTDLLSLAAGSAI